VITLYCLEEWRGKQRISPPGDNFTLRGQNSPLGDYFGPGVKVCPELRMGLWLSGVAHPPPEQKTWVRIPPGYLAMLLCAIDIHNIDCLCFLRNESVGLQRNIYF
jgi:hypothetical protein